MPNYREQNGEVGSYNNLKVWVLNGDLMQLPSTALKNTTPIISFCLTVCMLI